MAVDVARSEGRNHLHRSEGDGTNSITVYTDLPGGR